MNKQDLQFLLAYADVYSLQDRKLTEVLNETKYCNQYEKQWFLRTYHEVIAQSMLCEVKNSINKCGFTFIEALKDWDLL
jgi:hypothetical protein